MFPSVFSFTECPVARPGTGHPDIDFGAPGGSRSREGARLCGAAVGKCGE